MLYLIMTMKFNNKITLKEFKNINIQPIYQKMLKN